MLAGSSIRPGEKSTARSLQHAAEQTAWCVPVLCSVNSPMQAHTHGAEDEHGCTVHITEALSAHNRAVLHVCPHMKLTHPAVTQCLVMSAHIACELWSTCQCR